MKKMWVVSCNQGYACFFYVVGVFDDEELAKQCADQGSDRDVEEFVVNEMPKD